MPNMSYCRFENTYNDLIDCLDNISDEAGNDRDERYRIKMIRLLSDKIGLIENLIDEVINNDQAEHGSYIDITIKIKTYERKRFNEHERHVLCR